MTRGSFVLVGAAVAAGRLFSPPLAGAADPPAPTQLELAATPAVKLMVRGAGWMRVSQPALVAAGLDATVDPGRLRLFADGVEQGIRITGNGDATFDPDEALEFYGVGRDTLWTDARTYWLVAGATGTGGKPVPLVAAARGNASSPSFPAAAVLNQKRVYTPVVQNGDASNFFVDFISGPPAPPAPPVTEALAVTHLDTAAPATLQVTLQGFTTGTHRVGIGLNGQALGTCAFVGQVLQTCAFSPSAVLEGVNQITLVGNGDAPDDSLLAAVEIDYPHLLMADGDRLDLTAPPATRLALGGFSSPDVRVVDVTDPDSPVELVTGVSFDGAAYLISVSTPGDTEPHALSAFTDAQIGAPVSVTPSRPSDWADAAGGELVILSNAQLIDAVRPLADRRSAEGWSVELIDLQDVYDEFGAGDKTVFAVRDFLHYAHSHWRVPPRFVLLVGDASFDPRNFLGLGDFDLAPTKLIDAAEMETASDDWFVDWNSDGIPDIAIGRLPVRTAVEATTVVQKTLGYGGLDDLPQGGLFVADQSDGALDFEGSSLASEALVSDLMPVDSFFLSQPASTPAALIAKLNQGPFLVNYMGHGSVEEWEDLFTDLDAAALTNQRLSIYLSMNCLNGFFQDVHTQSLAEALLEAPNGGAVAVWASSTLGSFDPQAVLNQELLKRLTRTSLGEAAQAAKAAIGDLDARRTWILFGDPTLFGTPISSGGGQPPDAGAPDAGARDGGSTADASRADGSSADARATDGHGVDTRTETDSGAAPDGGPSRLAATSGCGCRIDPSGAPRTGLLVALGVVAIALGRRPRGRRRAQASQEER
jgi:MYXO-CTERM domain-containing protein